MHFQGSSEWVRGACIALIALAFCSPALAEKGKLRERLAPQVMAVVYPGAERLGMEEGSPPSVPVYKGDKIVAYVFSTVDIIDSRGYSGTPFDVIAGVDLSGRITGAKVVFHTEPIIVEDAGRQRELDAFLAREAGRSLTGGSSAPPPDYVAGATISSRAMHAAVLAAARLVLRARLAQPATTASAVATAPAVGTAAGAPAASTVDLDTYSVRSLDDLIAQGAVARRRVTSGEVAAALAKQGASGAKLDWPLGKDDDLYIEFLTALVTPTAIGGNLLGVVKLEEYKNQLPKGAEAIIVASRGPYDFFGTTYVQASGGNRFDRLRVMQNGKTFSFVQNDYTYAVPMPDYQFAALFALPANSGFDPKKPWRLEILVNSASLPRASVAFGLDYKLPDSLPAAPLAPASAVNSNLPQGTAADAPGLDADLDLPPPVPAWVEAWSEASTNVAILAVLLSVLTLIFIFQARLARFRVAHRIVRTGFLLVVLVWLGWTAGVQLSIVNVINYVMAPFNRFGIGFYLAEPLMVIVAVYAFISVLLIGRGVFCGWLCPFGALQELLGQLSKALGVPQWDPPPALEKRLWMGKYLAAGVVMALVLTQLDPAGASLEIEPFKTAISTKFTRAWPFVVYAGALLAIGLFSERAYCRFLCPLGGVLATLDRLHLLNLLKRRPECGSPCHLCERACPVRAILPTGKIVTSECFQCLDCQVEYYDEKRCPPLVQAAKLRSKTKPVAAMVKHV
jgi:transcriptional regulator of nitric oxide reductase/NAD-dependent dihydropyrimidine dehydrogenase PreA subunit